MEIKSLREMQAKSHDYTSIILFYCNELINYVLIYNIYSYNLYKFCDVALLVPDLVFFKLIIQERAPGTDLEQAQQLHESVCLAKTARDQFGHVLCLILTPLSFNNNNQQIFHCDNEGCSPVMMHTLLSRA